MVQLPRHGSFSGKSVSSPLQALSDFSVLLSGHESTATQMKIPPTKRRWRIGELAAATGVTVRTLHHYEQLGLLPSVGRTEGGHRLYGSEGIAKIYQIRALKGLGLSLAETALVLSGRASLVEVLRAHTAQVDAQIERLQLLHDRLSSLLSHAGCALAEDDLLTALEAMSRIEHHSQTHTSVLEETAEQRRLRWQEIRDALRICASAGFEASDPRTLEVARRAHRLIEEFSSGDPAVRTALSYIRSHCPPRELHGWDPQLMRYLQSALTKLMSDEHGTVPSVD